MDEVKGTQLYKRLNELNETFASKVLENANKIVKLIKKKTTINFPNYTNHDITHSINIINTMYELIQDKIEEFNELELALMIYSAVYHDVGMALDDDEIEKIRSNKSDYLYGKDFENILEKSDGNENLAVQEIIRISHGRIANDLITTEYREYFTLPDSDFYFDEELGKICQAHTENRNYIEKLEENWQIGKYSYNAQFIAILLRVADILGIDGSRTPLKLYNAISLNQFSDDEWNKNISITNTTKLYDVNDRKLVRIYGKCKNIKIHRKLLTYIKWIENELSLAVNMTSKMDTKYQVVIDKEVENLIK